ncbi:MAG: hypothetical protein R8M14_06740 [Ghiorsea sp.]
MNKILMTLLMSLTLFMASPSHMLHGEMIAAALANEDIDRVGVMMLKLKKQLIQAGEIEKLKYVGLDDKSIESMQDAMNAKIKSMVKRIVLQIRDIE